MNAVYKYTLRKYVSSWSTWIILLITMLLVFILGGVMPFKMMHIKNANDYALTSVRIVGAITAFISLFMSVFAGFKAATMFKDEVEDGTFLVMLSKPVSRSKIILAKWLSLQTVVIAYTFLVSLSFLVAIAALDNGNSIPGLESLGVKTLRSQIIIISLLLWVVLTVISLIFSSIALLLSTKLTVGTTIGISIALGVVIPSTQVIGLFTSKQNYIGMNGANFKRIESIIGINNSITDTKAETLYNAGIDTGDHDVFNYGRFFDVNFQLKTLSEIASERAVPQETRENLHYNNEGNTTKFTNVPVDKKDLLRTETEEAKEFKRLLVSSWEYETPYRIAAWNWFWDSVRKVPGLNFSTYNLLTSYGVNEAVTNANVDAIRAKLEEPGKLLEIISKDPKTLDASNYNEYGKAIYKTYRLMSQFIDDTQLADESTHEYSVFHDKVSHVRLLFKPIYQWVSWDKLEKYHSAHKFDFNYKHQTRNDTDLGFLGYVIDADMSAEVEDYNQAQLPSVMFYQAAMSALDAGHHLLKIRKAEYANKYVVLIVYVGIALMLVPTAYFVIRRKDFR